MRPAPIIEILIRFTFDLDVDECEVFDLDCGRFLAAGIGFETEWVAPADFSMASTPSQFRGFSRLLVYNAMTRFAAERKLKVRRNLGLRPSILALP
jgi:hypothetical protein